MAGIILTQNTRAFHLRIVLVSLILFSISHQLMKEKRMRIDKIKLEGEISLLGKS
jgi:hypothetical protein